MSCTKGIVVSSRSLVASLGTASSRNPVLRVLVPALALFILVVLYIITTEPVADRSAIWLPSTHKKEQVDHSSIGEEDHPSVEEVSGNGAWNSTLGFSSIYFVYLPSRYDRMDAMSLQSYLSGVDLTDYPAVGPQMIKDVGMPPTRKSGKLRTSEKGCWRAHANVSIVL